MLTLHVKQLLAMQGIEKPYSFLLKNGFTHLSAASLINDDSRAVSHATLEKLCLLLKCTPNDLYIWQPGNNIDYLNQPLQNLKPKYDKLPNNAEPLSIDMLKEVQDFISSLK